MTRPTLQIIDRRKTDHGKATVNKARFQGRFKDEIRRSVDNIISGRSIRDMDKGGEVKIPRGGINEPAIRHGKGGDWETVHPGNREFTPGDRISRPQGDGEGEGNGPDPGSGESIDDFEFVLSREEFLSIFFDDLELPDLARTVMGDVSQYRFAQRGFRRDGSPATLNIIRSMQKALARRIAIRGSLREQLREAERALAEAENNEIERQRLQELVKSLKDCLEELGGNVETTTAINVEEKTTREIAAITEDLHNAECCLKSVEDPNERTRLTLVIESIRRRLEKIPFIDEVDLRYRNRVAVPEPTSRAVMFCLMDVSGSMDENKKDLAKRFFTLLYLFLTRKYERVEVVFIRHTEDAEEVDEETFFHDPKSGGTLVYSALELMHKIALERYPSSTWNVYVSQASDGDAFGSDAGRSANLVTEKILPIVRYFAYIEVPDSYGDTRASALWAGYAGIKDGRFAMKRVRERNEIYPVLRDLFRAKEKK